MRRLDRMLARAAETPPRAAMIAFTPKEREHQKMLHRLNQNLNPVPIAEQISLMMGRTTTSGHVPNAKH